MMVIPTGSSARSSVFIPPQTSVWNVQTVFTYTWSHSGKKRCKWCWNCCGDYLKSTLNSVDFYRAPSCLNGGFRHQVGINVGITEHLQPSFPVTSAVPSRCWDGSPEPCLKLKMYLHSLSTTWQHNLNLASVYAVKRFSYTLLTPWACISTLDEVCQPEIRFFLAHRSVNVTVYSVYFNTGTMSHTVYTVWHTFIHPVWICWVHLLLKGKVDFFSCFALSLVCWSLV